MNIKSREELVEYLSKLSITDRLEYDKVLADAHSVSREASKQKYKKNKQSYQNRKEKQEAKSLEFFEQVKVGDLVQMYGTKDRQGLRLVLAKHFDGLECRKMRLSWPGRGNRSRRILVKEPYITTHKKTKIKKILNINDFETADE